MKQDKIGAMASMVVCVLGDDAAALYQEALRLDPNHGNAYIDLALVLFSQGKYQEALECLVRAEGPG